MTIAVICRSTVLLAIVFVLVLGQDIVIRPEIATGQNNVFTDAESARQSDAQNDGGLLSRWPLDDGEGATKFTDVIGANHGSCDKAAGTCPTATTGFLNGAFSFTISDGIGKQINAPDDLRLAWSKDDSFTIELRVKMAQDCGPTMDERRVFIGKYSPTASWWVGCGENDTAAFYLRDSLGDILIVEGTTKINDDKWHHLIAEYDGIAGESKIYVDTALERAEKKQFAGSFTNSNPINIGYFAVDPFYYFEGVLDEISIYAACGNCPIFLPIVLREN